RSRHERGPMIDVTAHQSDGNSETHRHVFHGADEGERIHEFLYDECERKRHHGEDAGKHEPGRHTEYHLQPAETVDHRLLLDVPWRGSHETHHQPGTEGNGHPRIDQDQRDDRVL